MSYTFRKKTLPVLAALALTAGAAGSAVAEINTRPLPAPPQQKVTYETTPSCDDVQLSVYFSSYDAMLSDYARNSIAAASDQLKGCAITEIDARVTSEEAHTDEDKGNLSEHRAEAVIAAFQADGLEPRTVSYQVTDATRDGTSLMARRVEVTVKATQGHGL